MERFSTLDAVAAPMPTANIDTDQLIPKQFLKIVRRTGLGEKLLHAQRYDDKGAPRRDFVLNNPIYKRAEIIVAGENFGCGSSREHAVWALMDFGVRCVISTSFSDIFAGNAAKNGLLAAIVTKSDLSALLSKIEENPGTKLFVDLKTQTIEHGERPPTPFDIDPFTKERLLTGHDEVQETLSFEADIAAYETKRASEDPSFIPQPIVS